METDKSQHSSNTGDPIYAVPKKSRSLSPNGQFGDDLLSLEQPNSAAAWTNFDSTEAQGSSPFTSTPTATAQKAEQSVSLQLNPFFAGQSTSTFDSGMSREFNNPLYDSDTAAFPSTSPTSPEPNITMDLLEGVFSSPIPSNPFTPPPSSMQLPPPIPGSLHAPFGQPQVPPMGAPMGSMASSPFQQAQAAASTDLLSSPPSENFLDFSQPLLPSVVATSNNASEPPPKVDAFADLVSIARKGAPEPAAGTIEPVPKMPQQKKYVPMNKMAAEKSQPPPLPTPFGQLQPVTQASAQPNFDSALGISSSTSTTSTGFDMLDAADAAFGGTAATFKEAANQPTSWQQFDDIFGGPKLASPQQPSQATSAGGFDNRFGKASTPAQSGWIEFEDEEKGQWL